MDRYPPLGYSRSGRRRPREVLFCLCLACAAACTAFLAVRYGAI